MKHSNNSGIKISHYKNKKVHVEKIYLFPHVPQILS